MPKITLSGPAELLTAIPFQLGFRPTSSVVVVCFHGKRLGLVVRVDVVPREQADTAADQLLPALLRDSPSSVALVGFEERAGESMALSDALSDALQDAGLALRDRLVVRGGRWYALDCDCCPADGTPMPEPADVSAVASYVALGRTVLRGREDLSLLLEPLARSAPRHGLATMAIEAWSERFSWSLLHETAQQVERVLEDGSGEDGPGKDGSGEDGSGEDGPGKDGSGDDDPEEDGSGEDGSGEDGSGRHDSAEEDSDPVLSPYDFMVTEALVAWGGLLRGEIAGHGLEHWLPALVSPLRDPDVRDALIAWICPGALRLDAVDDDLLARLELHLGHEVRLADPDPVGGAQPLRLPELANAESTGWPGADDWEAACAPKMIQARLESLCRATPAKFAAPLLSVVASFAWWSGDGARARVAVDRALSLEPDHRLCRLIGDALDQGLRARPA